MDQQPNYSKKQHHYPYMDDEITLKELILKINEFWKVLWDGKLKIILAGCILAGISLVLSLRKPIYYTSAITFMVGETEDQKGNMILSLEQLQMQGGITNHKIIEIARASQIVHKVLLSPMKSNQVMSEVIVEVYGLQQEWDEYNWVDIQLDTWDKINDSGQRKEIFNRLHEFLVGNKLRAGAPPGLMTISYDEDTELFKMIVKTVDDNLSTELITAFYNILSDFYIDKTVGTPQRTFKQLLMQEDSLLTVVNSLESKLAYASDRTRGIVSSVAKVSQSRQQRRLDQVTGQYDEIRANRQRIEYILQTETPDFQIIDQTFVPIIEKSSKIKSSIIGGILGVFLTVLFFIARHIIRTAMAE
jgi:hypothetical protein